MLTAVDARWDLGASHKMSFGHHEGVMVITREKK